MQRRGEADLGVHAAVVGQVAGALGGHPVAGLRGLHDADRVFEGLEVETEVEAIGAPVEPVGQRGLVVGRKNVAGSVGQIQHRGRAEAAVEVVVEEHLGGSADRLQPGRLVEVGISSHGSGYPDPRMGQKDRAQNPRRGRSGPRCSQLSAA